MRDYQYQVLNAFQIRMLDKQEPWAYKIKLSQLIDEALSTGTTGVLPVLIVSPPNPGDPANYGDGFIGRDLYVTRYAYIANSIFVGGGYGSSGCTIDVNGNVVTDGFVDCTTSGLRRHEEVIANATDAGIKGEHHYGQDAGVWYDYQCVADNTWVRAAYASW